jgi:twitching motility protein PilT
MCDERQRLLFADRHQVDLAYSVSGLGRFRVNLFRQRGSVSAVLRIITSDAGAALVNLPQETIDYFRDQEKGIVLVTGATGSGKSTTLARIIDEINRVHNKMIVTVEDPIEYLHRRRSRRSCSASSAWTRISFSDALVAAMRQDPDVIMIGEIRDHATANAAISAAQTGTWCSAPCTRRTRRARSTACSSCSRRASATRPASCSPSRSSASCRSACCPRGGSGRVAAMEIVKATLRIKDLIRDEDRTHELYDAIRDARLDGMQLFDDHLAQLYAEDKISYDVRDGRRDVGAGLQDRRHAGRRRAGGPTPRSSEPRPVGVPPRARA